MGKNLSKLDQELLEAVKLGDAEFVKVKIEKGANVNARQTDKFRHAPLHLSSWNGHIDIVKALIEANADINIKNANDNTALRLSSEKGHTDIVKALIDADADVNIKDADDYTALHVSSRNGHIDIVKALVEAHADVNIKDRDHTTALHLSSREGHLDIVKALVEAHADITIKNVNDATALHFASRNGHTDIAKALIGAKADVNIKDANDDTALHISLRVGHIDIAIALIEADTVDLNIRDENKNTGLHLASVKGATLIVQKLIECRADPNLKNAQGLKPVLLGALYGYTEIVRKLLNGGATIDVHDPTEISLMHLVLMESDKRILRDVLTDEIHCNAPGNNDRTVLHLAARLGCHEHINCLLSIAGIDVNPKDTFGKTPLHCASEIGKTETINELLRAGCKLHDLDNTEKSVLHIASIYGHSEPVKLFISEHLDPSQVDMFGRNCLHYGVLYRNDDVVRELLKTADNSECNRADSNGKTPIQYLHDCERSSLISRLLKGDSDGIEEFPLEEYYSFQPDLSKCLHVSEISKTTYIGSVNVVEGHHMSSFIKNEVREIICSAIPNDNSVKVIGVGSSFEGTKNGLPDEFDFIIKLYQVNSNGSGQEGYGKMERNEDEVKRLNIIGSYGIWLWQKLMAYWSECEIKGKTKRTDGGRQIEMSLPPQRHPDRKTCTTWTWLYSYCMFKDLPVSIDFVPAIETDIGKDKIRSTWMMADDEMRRKKCYIVPKIPHETSSLSANFSVDDINQLGRVSYPALEVDHLRTLDPRIKNVYITAKCLRKPEVCGFKIKNEKGEVKAASEFVTSYRLKSVFLHLVQLLINSNLSLGKMVLMVYEQLEKCLERDNLPMFFDPEVNVLAGSKLSTEECLTVTRMMARFARALYERDFSTVMEKDSDEEAKAIKMEIETERTAQASYDKEMHIYEQKMKEWNNKSKPRGEEPTKPINKQALLNASVYILENLQQVILAEKCKNTDSYTTNECANEEDTMLNFSMLERQAQVQDMLYEDKAVFDRKIINNWKGCCQMENSDVSQETEKPLGRHAKECKNHECADEDDRSLAFDMLERHTQVEEMLHEKEVVYDRKVINDWIANHLRKCRSDKEKRDFLSEVRECVDEKARLLSFDMSETTC